MNVPGAPPAGGSRGLRPWLWFRKSLSTGGAVLVYHGLGTARDNAFTETMHVPVDRFAATVRALKRAGTLVPLMELVSRHLRGESTKGLTAITGDDGYVSLALGASDILRAESVPLTLFVVLEAAGSGAPFWWDRVDEVFAAAPPDRWRRFEEECRLPEVFRAGQPASLGPLRPLRQWILAEHRGRWPAALEAPLAALERELGCGTSQRPLRHDALERVLENPLVDVGVHTVSHAVLPLLSDEEMRAEIRRGFDGLRERYPGTIPVLAPPYGLYDARTLRIAREEGLSAFLTLDATLLDDRSPNPAIPRFGMTRRHQPWKVFLWTLGCWPGARPGRGRDTSYPALPSASS